MNQFITRLGVASLETIEQLGNWSLMVSEMIFALFSKRARWGEIVFHLSVIGIGSIAVVTITGAFTGMVFAAQTYFQFHKVQLDSATGAVVSVAMARELGPVLTALMVSGRVGAAIAAELGSMKVTEQVDALKVLATDPVDYLIVPRFTAMMISMPLLTAISIATGILSGYLVATRMLGVDAAYYIFNMKKYTDAGAIFQGLTKSVFFGFLISTISCYKGISCGGGAEGVGRATTEAVVVSSIAVLISNFFLTMLINALITP